MSAITLQERQYAKAEKAFDEILNMLDGEITAIKRTQGGTAPEDPVRRNLKVKRGKMMEALESLLRIKTAGGGNALWSSYAQKWIIQVEAYCRDSFFESPDAAELNRLEQVITCNQDQDSV